MSAVKLRRYLPIILIASFVTHISAPVHAEAINVSKGLASINLIVTATKKGQKSITFKVTTDSEGDAVVKTNKNLNGHTVTLALGKTKLDSDLVRK